MPHPLGESGMEFVGAIESHVLIFRHNDDCVTVDARRTETTVIGAHAHALLYSCSSLHLAAVSGFCKQQQGFDVSMKDRACSSCFIPWLGEGLPVARCMHVHQVQQAAERVFQHLSLHIFLCF